MIDTIFRYKIDGSFKARCRLQIFPQSALIIVVVSEFEDNGRSITNAPERLITDVLRDYNLDPKQVIWIEYYSPSFIHRVRFDWNGQDLTNFQWDSVTRQEVEVLIGQSI